MSLQNLREQFLYELLPEGIISLDEQKLVQAVVGGYQDRVDDLRAYTSKLELLLTGQGLPETDSLGTATTNVVVARIQSPKGKVYNRSLEILDDTPVAGDPALFTWAQAQLDLDEDNTLLSVAYGVDVLRTVDANVLPYLAATVGAVLYQTAAQDPANEDSDARRMLQSWFPRLQFKGTAESFETLGRLLGFDDVRLTPLWTRLSPRVPNDIGAPENEPDFAALPEFYPKQVRDAFYDPLDLTDGPFFTWRGTATARFGTNSTEFYTQVVNGFNPFLKVTVTGTSPTDPDPASSPYILVGGGPETKAYVNPSGTGLRFEAIAAGSSFNGLALEVQDWDNGTHRLLSVTERLSAIKYRSSFYDLALTMDFDHAATQFGTHVVGANRDLVADPTSANFGTMAQSPYRPWKGGSVTQDLTARDWITEITANGNQTVTIARSQAGLTDRQLDQSALSAAGIQVVQAMEEVRPATRQPRQVSTGYLIRDSVGYADYYSQGTLFSSTLGVGTYWGTLAGFPLEPYQAGFELEVLGYGSVVSDETLASEVDLANSDFVRVRGRGALVTNGTYDYSNATWLFAFPNGIAAAYTVNLFVHYAPTSTEVVRPQPDHWSPLERAYQTRPEDELDEPKLDLADEYPWRRDTVGGGELVDYASYHPTTPDVQTVRLGQTVAVVSQTGAQYDVTVNKPGPEPPRFQAQERSLSPYVPGQPAIAFTGTFQSLDQAGIDQYGMDRAMQPGWEIYHFGLVQGVLVADPVKFFGAQHRDGLVAWYPFNEHPRDALAVVDHSSVADDLALTGVDPAWRLYDSQRGWYLALEAGASLISSAHRSLTDALSLSFWIRCPGTTAATTILQLGTLSLKLTASTLAVLSGATTVVSAALPVGWSFVALTYAPSAALWTLYQGTMTLAASVATSAVLAHAWSPSVTLSAWSSAAGHDWQDLRIWNQTKSLAQLELVRYHNPTPTRVLYSPSYVQAVNDYDRYGVRVLASGLVTPELLPSSIETPPQAWVLRYDSVGAYQAQSRYKETGLGSGSVLPTQQKLGLQWNTMTGAGTVVVSTGTGNFVGSNALWQTDNVSPVILQLLQSGSTPNGIPETWLNTGTASPWPNPQAATNPCRDRIWVKGDDKFVYEVKVDHSGTTGASLVAEKLFTIRTDAELKLTGTEGTLAPILQTLTSTGSLAGVYHYEGAVFNGTISPGQLFVVAGSNSTTDDGLWSIVPSGHIVGGTVLPSAGTFTVNTDFNGQVRVYHPARLLYADQPTGAEVSLTSAAFANRLSVGAAGTVYAAPYAGTVTSDVVYLYGNEETNADLSGAAAYSAWVDKASLGMNQSPPVAALGQNGQIAFEMAETMLPGFYRLEVTSGNIGQVDEAFDGFRVLITVGDHAFEARLCAGQTGANFSATDTFEFYLPRTLSGSPSSWLMTFDWLNALRDDRHGTVRQLKISALKAVRLNTSLYRLSLVSGGTSLVELNTAGTEFPRTPGGWMAVITSWGTLSAFTHESKLYVSNDTVVARQPFSDLLTATTGERREDIILAAPYAVTDLPQPALPSYTTIVIT